VVALGLSSFAFAATTPATPAAAPAPAAQPAAPAKPAAQAKPDAKTTECQKQAKDKGLKGPERKKFVADCVKAK
jgi:hypothetical protein